MMVSLTLPACVRDTLCSLYVEQPKSIVLSSLLLVPPCYVFLLVTCPSLLLVPPCYLSLLVIYINYDN